MYYRQFYFTPEQKKSGKVRLRTYVFLPVFLFVYVPNSIRLP